MTTDFTRLHERLHAPARCIRSANRWLLVLVRQLTYGGSWWHAGGTKIRSALSLWLWIVSVVHFHHSALRRPACLLQRKPHVERSGHRTRQRSRRKRFRSAARLFQPQKGSQPQLQPNCRPQSQPQPQSQPLPRLTGGTEPQPQFSSACAKPKDEAPLRQPDRHSTQSTPQWRPHRERCLVRTAYRHPHTAEHASRDGRWSSYTTQRAAFAAQQYPNPPQQQQQQLLAV